MSAKPKPLPRFVREAEERAFRETQDSIEYLDWSQAWRVRFGRHAAGRRGGAPTRDMVKDCMSRQSPIVSEFSTTEAAEAHDAWVRDKVRRAMLDTRATVAHDDVMAEIDAIIATGGQEAAE